MDERWGLYIVVRHPGRPVRVGYENDWSSAGELKSIHTEPWLAELLDSRRHRGARVYVYRTAHGPDRPRVIGEAEVLDVSWDGLDLPKVDLRVVAPLDVRPPRPARRGEICFSAEHVGARP